MCSDYQRRKSYQQYAKALARLGSPRLYRTLRRTQSSAARRRLSHNIAPIFRARDGVAEIVSTRWGLLPFWHRGAVKDWKFLTFNARAETVATTRSFRELFAKRRSLILADGWYDETGAKGDKQRWLFTRQDGEELFFAGLWDHEPPRTPG